MSQHPVTFIGSLRYHAAVLSVVSPNCQTAQIDMLVARIEAATNICKSTVYRSVLITEPVTGKIDMREKAAL